MSELESGGWDLFDTAYIAVHEKEPAFAGFFMSRSDTHGSVYKNIPPYEAWTKNNTSYVFRRNNTWQHRKK